MNEDNWRSIRSFSRARGNERGFVLVATIVVAVLYFGLMQLMLIDSSRTLREAQRFRARIVAATLAENGAELAAHNMIDNVQNIADAENDQGTMNGSMVRTPPPSHTITKYRFDITGEGTATGVVTQKATVNLQGRLEQMMDGRWEVRIQYASHSQ